MKLTERDREFVETLRNLVDAGRVWVELRCSDRLRFVLRRNYGAGVESRFGMTRQGVRWRFQRLMDAYVSAYETVLWVETTFGTDLRGDAMRVVRARAEQREKSQRGTGGARGGRLG